MQKPSLKQIRTLTIRGMVIGYLPVSIIGLIEPPLETLPDAIEALIVLLVFSSLIYGCIVLGRAANKYAAYKGYKNPFYIYSILNIFGLCFLFLLKNKNQHTDPNKDPIENFSLSAILISWFAIPLLFTIPLMLIALYIAGIEGFEEYYSGDNNLSQISNILIEITFIWYIFREFKRTNLNYKAILGSFQKIDFKLPIGLAIIEFLFARGFNSITLYGLSFVFPGYVEEQINKVYATSFIGWICVAIGALLFAPVMEEIIYRGIVFQKLTITQNFRKALLTSAIFFTIIHFRYDLIFLFIAGVVLVLLYLKTKQLIVPIISHFFYNLIVIVINLHDWLSSRTDPSQMTIAEYQQKFSDNFEIYVLLIAVSAPYLCYFIYKNYPRNYNVQQLPYFVNQRITDEQNG